MDLKKKQKYRPVYYTGISKVAENPEHKWWDVPILIDVPPPLVVHGCLSKEKHTQHLRQQSILQEIYFTKEMIPDSAHEPDLEMFTQKEPEVIPLVEMETEPVQPPLLHMDRNMQIPQQDIPLIPNLHNPPDISEVLSKSVPEKLRDISEPSTSSEGPRKKKIIRRKMSKPSERSKQLPKATKQLSDRYISKDSATSITDHLKEVIIPSFSLEETKKKRKRKLLEQPPEGPQPSSSSEEPQLKKRRTRDDSKKLQTEPKQSRGRCLDMPKGKTQSKNVQRKEKDNQLSQLPSIRLLDIKIILERDNLIDAMIASTSDFITEEYDHSQKKRTKSNENATKILPNSTEKSKKKKKFN